MQDSLYTEYFLSTEETGEQGFQTSFRVEKPAPTTLSDRFTIYILQLQLLLGNVLSRMWMTFFRPGS